MAQYQYTVKTYKGTIRAPLTAVSDWTISMAFYCRNTLSNVAVEWLNGHFTTVFRINAPLKCINLQLNSVTFYDYIHTPQMYKCSWPQMQPKFCLPFIVYGSANHISMQALLTPSSSRKSTSNKATWHLVKNTKFVCSNSNSSVLQAHMYILTSWKNKIDGVRTIWKNISRRSNWISSTSYNRWLAAGIS